MKHRITMTALLVVALLFLFYAATAPMVMNRLVRQGQSLGAYRPILAFNKWAADRPALAKAVQWYHDQLRCTAVIQAD